jgi:8-oxo-dGTP pyrophosphatase MutT (NUDIX family)
MMPDFDDFIRALEERLRSPRPGLPAQAKMAPEPRPGSKTYAEVEATSLKAGVMILLYEGGGEARLVFIRRPSTVLHHKDQVSFPGGQIEAGEDFVRASLRETWEEIGVPQDLIHVLGSLTPLYIPPSNYCIYPVVGAAAGPLAFRPQPEEVAEIIEVPVSHLRDPRTVRRETWKVRGEPTDVPFYAFGPHKIWGATAMVLAEFLDALGPGEGGR